jgi:hypothetical protein
LHRLDSDVVPRLHVAQLHVLRHLGGLASTAGAHQCEQPIASIDAQDFGVTGNDKGAVPFAAGLKVQFFENQPSRYAERLASHISDAREGMRVRAKIAFQFEFE